MMELITQAKSDLEIRMYTNISNSIKDRLAFHATAKNFKKKKDKAQFDRLSRLYKIEIMNHIEYACIMYLDNKVNQHTFKEFYFDIIKSWAKEVKKTRTNPKDKTVYAAILKVNKLWKNRSE